MGGTVPAFLAKVRFESDQTSLILSNNSRVRRSRRYCPLHFETIRKEGPQPLARFLDASVLCANPNYMYVQPLTNSERVAEALAAGTSERRCWSTTSTQYTRASLTSAQRRSP